MSNTQHNTQSHNEESDGLVWISEGKVYVKNETQNGLPPLINPCDGVKLVINDLECNRLISVSEKDRIEIIPIETENKPVIGVTISDDEMSAYIDYIPSFKSGIKINDSLPVNMLNIRITQSDGELQPVSKQEILAALNVYGIVFGIQENAIEDLCKSTKPDRFLIAVGRPVKEPVDQWFEFMFDENAKKEMIPTDESDDKIDYKNMNIYSTVEPGSIIARLNESIPGVDGITVTGKSIPARKPQKLILAANSSVSFDEATGLVRARKSGRPSKILENNTITFNIYDSLVINEVSIKTGNVRFRGDLEVKGNVSESMEVVAKQNIAINGNVSFASVYAGNNIIVKGGVISSRLVAGSSNITIKDTSQEVYRIIKEIKMLKDNIEEFIRNDASILNTKNIQELVLQLLNGKNKTLPATIYDVINQFRNESYNIDEDILIELIRKLKVFLGDCSEITGIGYLDKVIESISTIFVHVDDNKITGNININYVLNSELIALGNIIINGRGCFSSKVFTKGKVVVNGIVRSGSIRAEKSIEINKVGTEMGVKTLLSVPANGWISIKVAYPDTTIKIGPVSHMFLKEQHNIRANLAANGKIAF